MGNKIHSKLSSSGKKFTNKVEKNNKLVICHEIESISGEEKFHNLRKSFEKKGNVLILDINLQGLKLNENVELRYFYLSCPKCNNYSLDLGFVNEIKCGTCGKVYDADHQSIEMKHDKSIKKNEREHLKKLDSEIKEITDLVLSVDM